MNKLSYFRLNRPDKELAPRNCYKRLRASKEESSQNSSIVFSRESKDRPDRWYRWSDSIKPSEKELRPAGCIGETNHREKNSH